MNVDAAKQGKKGRNEKKWRVRQKQETVRA